MATIDLPLRWDRVCPLKGVRPEDRLDQLEAAAKHIWGLPMLREWEPGTCVPVQVYSGDEGRNGTKFDHPARGFRLSRGTREIGYLRDYLLTPPLPDAKLVVVPVETRRPAGNWIHPTTPHVAWAWWHGTLCPDGYTWEERITEEAWARQGHYGPWIDVVAYPWSPQTPVEYRVAYWPLAIWIVEVDGLGDLIHQLTRRTGHWGLCETPDDWVGVRWRIEPHRGIATLDSEGDEADG